MAAGVPPSAKGEPRRAARRQRTSACGPSLQLPLRNAMSETGAGSDIVSEIQNGCSRISQAPNSGYSSIMRRQGFDCRARICRARAGRKRAAPPVSRRHAGYGFAPNQSLFRRAPKSAGRARLCRGSESELEYRSPEGRNEGFPGTRPGACPSRGRRHRDPRHTAALAAKAASARIPVVVAAAGDPVGIAHAAPISANLTGFGANLPGASETGSRFSRRCCPSCHAWRRF